MRKCSPRNFAKIAFLQFGVYNKTIWRRCVLWLYPEHRTEARQNLQFLNTQKLGDYEAEIEKIKNAFLSILRDIKKDLDRGEQPGETTTAAMFQTMQEAMKGHQQEPLSMDDAACYDCRTVPCSDGRGNQRPVPAADEENDGTGRHTKVR